MRGWSTRATRLLADGGIEAVTIDAVTRTAGVARATLYRQFGTGAELVAAAFERLLPPRPRRPPRARCGTACSPC